jgi:hypothetical protein
MAIEKKFKVTPAESYPLGHAKENKDASAYTGFKYPSGGGNDIGVYKQPMTNPKSADIEYVTDPNSMAANESTPGGMPARRVNAGNITRGPKTEGVNMRGYGAATKGIKSRGPLA